jgi:ATP-dependent Clp protease ATP-binding subunit ClpA
MATLHVRNVPEPLYEALRASADANRRSIGAQAIAMLNESLATGGRGFPSRGTFQAFADESRAAVVDAQAIVRELGQDHVGTEHLLLALVSNRTSTVAQALARPPHDVTVDAVRSRLERGPGVPKGSIPFTPKAKQALELALRESLRQHCRTIAPGHLAIGIVAAGGGGAGILAELGVGMDELRTALLSTFRFEAEPAPFRVVELADDWERQLNELAPDYELVQVVERRAIFRRR